MAPESDESRSPLPEFLSDLGRAAVGSSLIDEQALELMRAAEDPLWLRAVLCRAQAAGPLQSRLSSPELLVCLETVSGGRPAAPGRRQFDVEPLVSASLQPEPFLPTEEDRGEATSMADEDIIVRETGLAMACAVVLVLLIHLLFW